MKYIKEYRHNDEDEIRKMTEYLKPKLDWKFINRLMYILTTYEDAGMRTEIGVYIFDTSRDPWILFEYFPNGKLEWVYEWHPNTAKMFSEKYGFYYSMRVFKNDTELDYKAMNDAKSKLDMKLYRTPENRMYLLQPK